MSRKHGPGSFVAGIDTGGTFTDLVLFNVSTGEHFSAKILSTPENPAIAVLNGLDQLLSRAKSDLHHLGIVIHGTTVAANTLIERKGARTALLITQGFRDILETGSERRYDLYDILIDYPHPIVPRYLRLGIRERLSHDGTVLLPIEEESLVKAINTLIHENVESIALCFLHSYANPIHEDVAREFIASRNNWSASISVSSKLVPEIGEYGRVSTTVINAYIQPIMLRYLRELQDSLQNRGYLNPLYVMSSVAGTMPAEDAALQPVRFLESGPAAGAYSVSRLADQLARPNLLSFDMGGTTAKACAIRHGEVTLTTEYEAARLQRFKRGSGFPIKLPSVDIFEIGAGGGSIAYVDSVGLLQVGPQSAGADPGPACYGQGGEHPTVTDANLVLGYLGTYSKLGGFISLDARSAKQAITSHVAGPLKLSLQEAAAGIFDVVCQNMSNAIEVYSAEKGMDPSRFVLVAFGGAGPAHAWQIARHLNIREVVIPPSAGILSAFGCIFAPIAFESAKSHKRTLPDMDWTIVHSMYRAMKAEVVKLLRQAHATTVSIQGFCDVRYRGQRTNITIEIPLSHFDDRLADTIASRFELAYRELYGRLNSEVPIEVVTWRVRGLSTDFSIPPSLALPTSRDHHEEDLSLAQTQRRTAYFRESDRYLPVPVYNRHALPSDITISGPSIIEERDTTTVVPPGARAHLDEAGYLRLTVS